MIIHDFLDNDLYKFKTMNAIQKKFPDSEVVYRFVNRGNTSFPPGFADALKKRWRQWREWYFFKGKREVYASKMLLF
ncbi:MAG: hypothetical protein ACLUDU_08320 [Butyricimonas faecihominis]